MVSEILKGVAIFGIFLINKSTIDSFYTSFRFLFYLMGIGFPLAIIGDPICRFIYNCIKTRIIENSTRRMFSASIEKLAEASAAPKAVVYDSILTSAEIERLNNMRSKVSLPDAQQFPKISISGKVMPNLVPGAGLFTAKIRRYGEIQNLVVMLAKMSAVSEFENLCYAFPEKKKDFWAEGYLLPSHSGICYSILFVTSFRFLGRKITF